MALPVEEPPRCNTKLTGLWTRTFGDTAKLLTVKLKSKPTTPVPLNDRAVELLAVLQRSGYAFQSTDADRASEYRALTRTSYPAPA